MAASRSYPTLCEDLQGVPRGSNWRASILDGLEPERWTPREGLHVLAPAALLAIRIPVQRVTNEIEGYQRYLNIKRARAFARWIEARMEAGEDYLRLVSVIEVSIDESGEAYYTDGQHRAAGAVIARQPLRVLATKRTEAEARRLFASQALAIRPSRNIAVLDGDTPLEEYIQDAVTSDDHPWSGLISPSPTSSSRTRMSVTTAYGVLRVYASMSTNQQHVGTADRFEAKHADELAVLISAFGSKATNPDAFSSVALRAIALAARGVFRERRPHKSDRDRWIRHMTRFSFQRHRHVRSTRELAEKLVDHWNKRLPAERRVRA